MMGLYVLFCLMHYPNRNKQEILMILNFMMLNNHFFFFLHSILKQMRRNRDEEAELMKNVEGWEVGTYYGEPIYFLDEKNQFRDPLFVEHFAHSDPDKYFERFCRHLLT